MKSLISKRAVVDAVFLLSVAVLIRLPKAPSGQGAGSGAAATGPGLICRLRKGREAYGRNWWNGFDMSGAARCYARWVSRSRLRASGGMVQPLGAFVVAKN